MAKTTSLTVTPAAFLIAITRSIGQDCAAQRRAPPIGTFRMVLGAPNGSVNCCSMKPLRARLSTEGPNPTAERPSCARPPSTDEPGLPSARGRSLVPQVTRKSRFCGSADKARRIINMALTPSTRA